MHIPRASPVSNCSSQSPLKSIKSFTRSQKPPLRRRNPVHKSRQPRILSIHNPRTPPPTQNTHRRKTRLLPTLLPHDPPLHLSPHTHVALYPKRNERATKLIISACIAAMEITGSKIAPVSEVQLKKAMQSPTILYPLYLLYLLLLPPRSSLHRENPRLRALSDRITEEHYFGNSVDFVA